VKVVLLGVATTLVQKADIAVAIHPGECDAALVRHHLFGREGVDAACNVAEAPGAAAEPLEDGFLLCAEACLERAVDVLARLEGDAAACIGARDGGHPDVAEHGCRAGWRVAGVAAARGRAGRAGAASRWGCR